MADDFPVHAFHRYGLELLRHPEPPSPDLRLPRNVARFLHHEVTAVRDDDELLGGVFIDDSVRPLAYALPYLGYLNALKIDPRRLLAPAVALGAAGCILFHYRPDNELAPSPRDIETAEHLRDAGEVVSVRLIDHLLVGRGERWTSLRQDGHATFYALGEEVAQRRRKPILTESDRRRQVLPKYVDPDCPARTWSGRGNMANWLKRRLDEGASLADFEVAERSGGEI